MPPSIGPGRDTAMVSCRTCRTDDRTQRIQPSVPPGPPDKRGRATSGCGGPQPAGRGTERPHNGARQGRDRRSSSATSHELNPSRRHRAAASDAGHLIAGGSVGGALPWHGSCWTLSSFADAMCINRSLVHRAATRTRSGEPCGIEHGPPHCLRKKDDQAVEFRCGCEWGCGWR